MPAAILFSGVVLTILIGVHVVLAAMARTAVQTAADSALAAAQTTAGGFSAVECDDNTNTLDTLRQCAGIRAARLALAGASSSVTETRTPIVVVNEGRGTVTALVYGGTRSPVLGILEVTGQACGPIGNIQARDLTASANERWRC